MKIPNFVVKAMELITIFDHIPMIMMVNPKKYPMKFLCGITGKLSHRCGKSTTCRLFGYGSMKTLVPSEPQNSWSMFSPLYPTKIDRFIAFDKLPFAGRKTNMGDFICLTLIFIYVHIYIYVHICILYYIVYYIIYYILYIIYYILYILYFIFYIISYILYYYI